MNLKNEPMSHQRAMNLGAASARPTTDILVRCNDPKVHLSPRYKLAWAILTGAVISEGCTTLPVALHLLPMTPETTGEDIPVGQSTTRIDASEQRVRLKQLPATDTSTASPDWLLRSLHGSEEPAVQSTVTSFRTDATRLLHRRRSLPVSADVDADNAYEFVRRELEAIAAWRTQQLEDTPDLLQHAIRGTVLLDGTPLGTAHVHVAADHGSSVRCYAKGARSLFWDSRVVPHVQSIDGGMVDALSDGSGRFAVPIPDDARVERFFVHITARSKGIQYRRVVSFVQGDRRELGDIELNPAAGLAGKIEMNAEDFSGWMVHATHALGGLESSAVDANGGFCVERLYDGDWTLHVIPPSQSGGPREIRADESTRRWPRDAVAAAPFAKRVRVRAGRTTCIGAWRLEAAVVDLEEMFPTSLDGVGRWVLGADIDPVASNEDPSTNQLHWIDVGPSQALVWADSSERAVHLVATLEEHRVQVRRRTTVESLIDGDRPSEVALSLVEGVIDLGSAIQPWRLEEMVIRFISDANDECELLATGSMDRRGAFGPLILPSGPITIEVEDLFSGQVARAAAHVEPSEQDWQDDNPTPHWITVGMSLR